VTFATPWYALLGLLGLVPLAVSWQRLRTGEVLRAELGLAAPPAARRLRRPLAIAALFALLGLAAAQPAIRSQHEQVARADAQLFVVLDNSRSMLASPGANGPSRALRALAFTRRLHAALPDVPIGLGSLTNRVLPYLFATTQEQAFQLTLEKSYGIERPPPEVTLGAEISTFDALDDIAQEDFFSPSARKRVVVVLSDAETLPFRARFVANNLRLAHIRLIVVRFWRPDERVYRRDGSPERYIPSAPDELQRLRAAGWTAYDESRFAAVRNLVAQTLGHGPVQRVALERVDRAIASWLALLALVPLGVLLAPLLALRLPGPAKRRSTGPAHTPVAVPATSAE
jgi:hypothetical protein